MPVLIQIVCLYRGKGMSKIKKIKGKVVSGIGKGKYYVKQRPYFTLFKSLLGAEPYLGTLNIYIEDGLLKINEMPHSFKPNEFGEIRYSLGTLKDLKILILRPIKSIHPENVFEIVAPVRLRDKLKLKDGDEIEFLIQVID